MSRFHNLGHSISTKPHEKLFKFAELAIQQLSSTRHAILDALVRVDIFQNAQGEYVVNEIETFEADYPCKKFELQMYATEFVTNRWCERVTDLLNN